MIVILYNSIVGEIIMTEYCEICGEELDESEEYEGVCKKCSTRQSEEQQYERDDDFIDPGIT